MKINLRESLNELDMLSDNRYDLYNTYLSKNPSLDTKKKLSEAIYKNKSPKEIALILKEDWDDWDDSKEESEWTEMDSKSVRDSDGFLTDYTWYWRNNNGEDQHVFVFGDSDLYGPEDGYFDWECDSLEEAQEWFDNYVGPGDEDDDWMDESLKESRFIDSEYRDGDVVFVGDANGYHGSFLIEGDVKNIPKELYKHIHKITKYGNLDKPYYKVEYKLDSNHLFEEDYRKFFGYIAPILKNAGITIIDEDDLMNESLNESKVFAVHTLQNYPYIGCVELMDKLDKNGEGEKHRFTSEKELNDFTKELVKKGYKNNQGYPHLDESVEDTRNDFEMGRKYWNRLNLDIDFDSALDKWNKSSELAEPDTWYSKPLYSEEAWNDMVSMFSNKNESLDESSEFEYVEYICFEDDKIALKTEDEDAAVSFAKNNPEIDQVLKVTYDDPMAKAYNTNPSNVDIIYDRMDESLNEKMVKVEPSDKELNQVINVLNKYGFKVDDNYKPGRGLFGSYHIQVINPDLDYIDFDQLVKDVEPVGDALDNLSFDINMPITYNFGANDDNVITGGIDIHIGYKDDDMD